MVGARIEKDAMLRAGRVDERLHRGEKGRAVALDDGALGGVAVGIGLRGQPAVVREAGQPVWRRHARVQPRLGQDGPLGKVVERVDGKGWGLHIGRRLLREDAHAPVALVGHAGCRQPLPRLHHLRHIKEALLHGIADP